MYRRKNGILTPSHCGRFCTETQRPTNSSNQSLKKKNVFMNSKWFIEKWFKARYPLYFFNLLFLLINYINSEKIMLKVTNLMEQRLFVWIFPSYVFILKTNFIKFLLHCYIITVHSLLTLLTSFSFLSLFSPLMSSYYYLFLQLSLTFFSLAGQLVSMH